MRTHRALLPVLLFALAAPLTLANPAGAAELAGVNLPDTVQAGGQPLVLNGMGLRKKLVIKVYVGGLYLASKQRDAAKVLAADTPRQQVLHFLYGVTPEQMCEAWQEGLEANVPNATAEVKKNFQTLCTWMDGVEKGKRLVMTYAPGQGTTVEVAGKSKGTLPGKATADAILATWIGPKPGPGDDFKDDVLGK
ncbi:MAG TPA: chalcone isomerase family protein [Thermoanaerobaculia bacterium]|nr:chalcone isomerase family protein [Thermoanaerobaculia bacterium]